MAPLARRVGRRGAALLFFAQLDVIHCVVLLTAPRPLTSQYAWMDAILPLGWWAAAWGVAGLVCLAYAFRTYDTPAFMVAVAIKVAWGLLSLVGWLGGSNPRGYWSAAIWLAFAAFVFLVAGGIPPAVKRAAGGWRSWIRS